jgi:hypothetical protein
MLSAAAGSTSGGAAGANQRASVNEIMGTPGSRSQVVQDERKLVELSGRAQRIAANSGRMQRKAIGVQGGHQYGLEPVCDFQRRLRFFR